MATVVLSWAGSTLPGGWAFVGAAFGAALGGAIDASMQPAITMGKQDDVGVGGSTEGSAITRVWGRCKITGLLVWSPKLHEVKKTKKVGGFLGVGGQSVNSFTYYANMQHVYAVQRRNARIVEIIA